MMEVVREVQLQRQHTMLTMSFCIDAALQQLFEPEGKANANLAVHDVAIKSHNKHKDESSSNNGSNYEVVTPAKNSSQQPGPSSYPAKQNDQMLELVDRQMQEMYLFMQEMYTKMSHFQCNLKLLREVALRQKQQGQLHEDMEKPGTTVSQEAPPAVPTGAPLEVSSAQDEMQQPQDRATDSIGFGTFDSSSRWPLGQANYQETQTTQESQSTATPDMVVNTDPMVPENPTQPVVSSEPPAASRTQSQTRSSPPFLSRAIRVYPITPTQQFNQPTQSLASTHPTHDTQEQDHTASAPTQDDLLSSGLTIVKEHIDSPRPPVAAMRKLPGMSAFFRSSVRRLSIEHGLQHSGTENYIRHIQLDRLLKEPSGLPRRPSLLRRMSRAFEKPIFDHAENKLYRFSIHHESKKRLFWESIVMLVIVADVIATPLAISFGVNNPLIQFADTFNNIIYVADVFLRCLTSYTAERGAVLISDPRKTSRHYLFSRWFVFDLLSCFPWESILYRRSIGRVIGIAKCVRLVQLPKLTRRIVPLGLSGILGIVELFGIVFMLSHFNACFWNVIALDWRRDTVDYDQKTVFWRYALCWSTVIGAINASPPIMHNPTEEITIGFLMIMGNVLQATVFGSVAHVISSFNEKEDTYHKKLMLTHDRCRFLGIPDSLSKRIQSYFQNLYRETKTVSADTDAFINELSPALVCDVKYSLYRDMLKQIPFLAAKRVDNSVVELLVMHLTTIIFIKDDVVTRKGERADWMGFIGIKGSVALLEFARQRHRVRRVLRKGDYFGETSVFQASTRENTIVALSWVQIHQLFRKDFESVKTNYPDQGSILEEEMSKYMTSKAAHKL